MEQIKVEQVKVKSPFATRNCPPEKVYTVTCKKSAPKFGEVVDKETGRKTVKVVGETNLYQMIQENKAETLIYNVIDKYNKGHTELIGENVGGFIDTIGVPNTLQDMLQVQINGELAWQSLPLELRRKYGHDVGAFLVDVQKQSDLKKQQEAELKRQQAIAQQQTNGGTQQ